jgi:hypothetical protein
MGSRLGSWNAVACGRGPPYPVAKGSGVRGLERGLVSAVILALLLASCSSSQAKQATPTTQASQPVPASQPVQATQPVAPTQATQPGQAQQAPVSFTDPDDVNLPLDLKTLTHSNDASTITYTVETYEPFRDDQVDFSWGIDKDNDGIVDIVVSAEFVDGKLDAKVETPSEKGLGPATVSRTGPAGLRVSFSRQFIGSAASYQYQVKSISDLNHNDEEDPGETDVAPDTGFYSHRL